MYLFMDIVDKFLQFLSVSALKIKEMSPERGSEHFIILQQTLT